MFAFVNAVEPWEAYERSRASGEPSLVDVRSQREFALGHARGAVSVPLDKLEVTGLSATVGVDAGTSRTLYVICESGLRAEQAAHKLARLGLHNTAIVRGGTQAWCREGLPMHSPAWLPSIEAQIRIAIGLVALVIVAKATLIDPVFLFLLAALGVSLVLAATRRQWSLVRWFRRLPWNRGRVSWGSAS
jgi:rhodanese-related sulfurtransferase